mgnify:CR=1 FL=1
MKHGDIMSGEIICVLQHFVAMHNNARHAELVSASLPIGRDSVASTE